MPTYDTPKAYRAALGFTNQNELKKYFKATDIKAVNWDLLESYNARLIDLFSKINAVINEDFRMDDGAFSDFQSQMNDAYRILKEYRIIEDLFINNGRPREAVYFNWMRGYLVTLYFRKVVARVFDIEETEIEQLGEDNLQTVIDNGNYATFKKEAIADLKIESLNYHIEIQAGFTGENDIKKSKALDAHRRLGEGWQTYTLHFDLYNGKLAVIDITHLASLENNRWIQNAKFEGVYTVKIPSEAFKWNITDAMPNLDALSFTIE